MKCVRCGTELSKNEKYCLGCGFEVGSTYEKSETLDSLMEMPVNELITEKKDDAEELLVDDVTLYNENIDGSIVSVSTSNVSEGEIFVPLKKTKKHSLFIIFLVFLLVCLFAFKLMYKPDNNTGIKPEPPKKEVKPNIINHPTSLYSFGNRFIVKINNLWTLLDKNITDGNVVESKYFIIDGANLTMNVYNYDDDAINKYIDDNKITVQYEVTEINGEKYYLFAFDNNKIYVKIVDNYLYAFEFFYSENIDKMIDDIMNNVIFYK